MVKIEDVAITGNNYRSDAGIWNEFILGVRDLEVNQSFVIPKMPQHYRVVLSAAKTLLNRRFVTRVTDEGHYRVGRVE